MKNKSLGERIALLEKKVADLKKENKTLQKVKGVQEIQNVMSMHEYYHAACMHKEEVDAIWAQKTPGVAFEEAAINGRYVGLEAIKGFYVEFFGRFLKTVLREVREIFPQLKDDPENELAFGVQILHTLTTPVIEVAGDGKTAKAVWLSPGHITLPMRGKLQAFWHWDRYAVDFVKEDGKWKIWHMFVGKDFSTPYEKSWVEAALDSTPGIQLDVLPDFPKPNAPSLKPYGGYSPFKVAQFEPIPPVPYRTFRETFSY
jgi:hypothetical protein